MECQMTEHTTLAPQEAAVLSRLFDLDANRRANLFKRYLQLWFYYNLYPHALRAPAVVNDWLADPSFEDFYGRLWQKSKEFPGCKLENIRESAAS
jgi:hypothetical protein